jgi:hypothetical protein
MHEGKYLPKRLVHPVRSPVTVNSVAEEEQWLALGYEPAKPAAYSEYPKSLAHPDYSPTKMVSAEKHGAPVAVSP